MLKADRQKFVGIAANGIAAHLSKRNLHMGIHYGLEIQLALRFASLNLTGLSSTDLVTITNQLNFLSFAAKLPAGKSLRMETHLSKVVLQIPLPPSLHSPLNSSQMPRSQGSESYLGVGLNDELFGIDLLEPGKPHAMFAGSTQSGKTTAAMNFVHGQVVNGNGQFLVFDTGKNNRDWKWLERSVCLIHPVVTGGAQVVKILNWLETELKRRKSLPGETFEALYLVIDELKDMLDNYPECSGIFSEIARLGATYNMHIIGVTQYTQESILGPKAAELKKLLIGFRIIGRVSDAKAAYAMAGLADTGAEKLGSVGDFVRVSDAVVGRFNTSLLLESDKENIPRLETSLNLFENPFVLKSHSEKPTAVVPVVPDEDQVIWPDTDEIKRLARVVALWSDLKRPPGLEKIRNTTGCGTHERARMLRIKAGQFLYFFNQDVIGQGGISPFDDVSFKLPKLAKGLRKD